MREDTPKIWGGGNPKNKSKTPTNIRNLEITNFNLTLPIDLDFDKELFFDLVDKDRANLPQQEQIKMPYKYLITNFDTHSLDNIHTGAYFSNGYWFSLAYFKHLDSTIRADFSLKTPLSHTNANLKARILSTKDSVFLHIRRGDYLQYSEHYTNLCEGKYYEGAIRLIKSKLTKPHIFIFSNDIAWCERNFLSVLSDECKEGVKFEFVANNGEDSAVQEMELMRSCQNAIIANSTFSWWAGYLIDNPRKIVVMPNRYAANSAPITYSNVSQVYDAVVLVDSHTGAVVAR